MRYRRFGKSDLEVSEVGFGTWTLASNWWGEVEDKEALLRAALDAGINFIDTAPVYGSDGVGETLLADFLKGSRDDIVITTKCGYDIDAERKFPGQSERPHDWRPDSIRKQLEDSLRRLQTDRVELYQLHNTRIEPILADDLWDELEKLRAEGKILELGVALGPAIGWVEEGVEALRTRPIASLQTVFNILEQEPGLTFAGSRQCEKGASASSLASRTHRTRSRDGSHPTPSSRPGTTAPTETRTTCSTTSRRPRPSRSCGRAPVGRSGRRRWPGSSPTRRSRRCSRRRRASRRSSNTPRPVSFR